MTFNVEKSVLERYELGAKEPQPSLCCPTEYEQSYLSIIPEEIIVKDYGCGDPTRYVNGGETVLDLGSGAGKNCYILAQKVGENGSVIGVDFNEEMLNLAKKYQQEMASKLGYLNTRFVKGKIQDLKLPLVQVESYINNHPIQSLSDLIAFEAECDRLRVQETLIKDNSVDVVISNCVLNLVKTEDKKQLFQEIYRVLKEGGRAVISDIVCDEDLPPEIINDPELWSGCIAGAFREDLFLEMFAEAGFYGIEILSRQDEPWQVINGIEFRSLTVRAYKPKQGVNKDKNQAIIYKGPWKKVEDDWGNIFYRGERIAVSHSTFEMMTEKNSPYSSAIIGINPLEEISLEEAKNFCGKNEKHRSPQETKGNFYQENKLIKNKNSCC